jgi:hypothetical protein
MPILCLAFGPSTSPLGVYTEWEEDDDCEKREIAEGNFADDRCGRTRQQIKRQRKRLRKAVNGPPDPDPVVDAENQQQTPKQDEGSDNGIKIEQELERELRSKLLVYNLAAP